MRSTSALTGTARAAHMQSDLDVLDFYFESEEVELIQDFARGDAQPLQKRSFADAPVTSRLALLHIQRKRLSFRYHSGDTIKGTGF